MEKRLQTINKNTVLEITENKPVKRTLSEKSLLRRREYLEQGIAKFQGELAVVLEQLQLIYDEQDKEGRQ